MDTGLWHFIFLSTISKHSQQVIHEFFVVMFSVFAATKATEYISLEITKFDKHKSSNSSNNEIWTRIFLLLMFSGNVIAAIGHFLIIYAAGSDEICQYQSVLLQFGPVLSMWSKTGLLFNKYIHKNAINIIMPILMAIISTQLIPKDSYGIVDREYPNWCWIQNNTEIDSICRFCAYYGQLFIVAVFTLYILIGTTSPTQKTLLSREYYHKLKAEILFLLGLIICFIIPSLTRLYQYFYPHTVIPWIIVSLTTGSISFVGVVDVFIYRFYLKYDQNTTTESSLRTEKCKPVIIRHHSTNNNNDIQQLRTCTLINGYFNELQHHIPSEIRTLCVDYTKLNINEWFLDELKEKDIEIEYNEDDISDVAELEQLIFQLRRHNGYNELFDEELAALLFAVYYEILNNYGPSTAEHEKLILCKQYCCILSRAFNKVHQQQKEYNIYDDIHKLIYQQQWEYMGQQKLMFLSYSLWTKEIHREKLCGMLMENNFGDLLINGIIKCFKINWKFQLYDDNDIKYIEEDDIFAIYDDENDEEIKGKIIKYDNIWMLEPFWLNKKRIINIQYVTGWAEPINH